MTITNLSYIYFLWSITKRNEEIINLVCNNLSTYYHNIKNVLWNKKCIEVICKIQNQIVIKLLKESRKKSIGHFSFVLKFSISINEILFFRAEVIFAEFILYKK